MTLLRRFGFDLLIVVAAIQSALAVALADGPNQPTIWFGPPAVGILVLSLIGRRWWPFAAPAALWLLAAALSFADGRLVVLPDDGHAGRDDGGVPARQPPATRASAGSGSPCVVGAR